MDVAALQTSRLTKDYGQGRGLFDLDLEIPPGQVFGFLGPNGAGKTTAIRCVMGMIRPTSGSAHVFGLNCVHDSVEVKRLVGHQPGEVPQLGAMRGKEVVSYFGGMRGGVDPKRVRELCQRFDLDLNRRFREYSNGNKQKLGIVLAFMHAPRLLLLDEPTGGLDPLNQQEFYRLVHEVREEGATVFLSSHVLSEVEHVCDRVGIVRAGHLVRVADLDELHAMHVHRVEVELAATSTVPETAIRKAPGVEDVEVDGTRITCTVRGDFQHLLSALGGADVVNLVSREPSLEEFFLTYYREGDELALRP